MPNLLIPHRQYLITPILTYIHIAIFILLVLISGQIMWFPGPLLYQLGANFAPHTLDGQWWRLITSLVLHGGLIHLVFNTLVLLNIGVYVEPFLGKFKYLALYLVTGICAGLASVLANLEQPVPSVGASGAIFGLYGFFLALLTTDLFRKQIRNQFFKGTLVFIAINLGIGFLIPIIDNSAHLGGVLSGLIIGYLSYPWFKNNAKKKQKELENNYSGES